MLTKYKRKIKSLSHFIWLILLIIITSLVTYFYELNRDTQYKNIKKTLNNIYFESYKFELLVKKLPLAVLKEIPRCYAL